MDNTKFKACQAKLLGTVVNVDHIGAAFVSAIFSLRFFDKHLQKVELIELWIIRLYLLYT